MRAKLTEFPIQETSDGKLYVLVTGARGYLGYGIAARLIDEYLMSTENSTDKKLILIVCARSFTHSQLAIERLHAHLEKIAQSSPFADKKRVEAEASGYEYIWQQVLERVLFYGVEADFCDVKSVYTLADKLVNSTINRCDYFDIDTDESFLYKPETHASEFSSTSLNNQGKNSKWDTKSSVHRLPRIDVIILTAGIGGWTGIDPTKMLQQFFSSPYEAVTRPAFNKARIGALIKSQRTHSIRNNNNNISSQLPNNSDKKQNEPPLGEVFCSNIFGQYLLVHELMPLLSRPASAKSKYGSKVIWVSSIANHGDSFSFDDFQGLQSLAPYESSKRLMDLMILPCETPYVSAQAGSFFDISRTISGKKIGDQTPSAPNGVKIVKPRNYLTHPGIFQSYIMPIPFLVALICRLVFYITRWLGSPWHTVLPYTAAIAPVRIALVDHETLDEIGGKIPTKIKWGSATDFRGNGKIKRTEVPGWGWDGNADTPVDADMRHGRFRDSRNNSKESTEEFELLSSECWKHMENLREEWEAILGLNSSMGEKSPT